MTRTEMQGIYQSVPLLGICTMFIASLCCCSDEMRGKCRESETPGLRGLIKEIEIISERPRQEKAKYMVEALQTKNLNSYLGSENDERAMDSVCKIVRSTNNVHLMSAMVEAARGDDYKEMFAMRCIGLGKSDAFGEIQSRWANSVDARKNLHLLDLLRFRKDGTEIAREILVDNTYGPRERCIAASVLSDIGGQSDIEKLRERAEQIKGKKKITKIEEMRGLHTYPMPAGTPRVTGGNCAEEAAEFLKKRLKEGK